MDKHAALREKALKDLRQSEVLAGLAASEVVVLSPPAGLTDGRRVSMGGRR